MLNDYAEDIKILTKLGLTPLQAQVYLVLAKLDEATIKTISSNSKIDRANVYRVLIRLQELNLIEKMLTNPTLFKALPVTDGVKMLLDRKEFADKEIKVKTTELLKKYQNHTEGILTQKSSEFILIPDGLLTMRKVAEMVNSNKTTHELIIYWSDFTHKTNETVERWTKLLLKGIQIRTIVFLEPNERLPRKVYSLRKYPGFQIRRIQTHPKATISIIDGNQALLSITPALQNHGNPGLWVNNHGIVGLIQEYFETTWHKAKPLP